MSQQGSSAITSTISRKAAIGASYLFAFRLFSRGLGFASTLVMARLLLPADFGLIAMASALSAAIDAFSQIGLHQALIRRVEDDEALHNTAFTLQFGRALITGLGIAACAPAASNWFSEPRLLPVLLILAGLNVFSGLRNIGVVAFGREMDYRRQFILLCVPRLIQVPVAIGAALLLHSYWALVIGIAMSKLLDMAMSYVLHPYRPRLSLHGWRELTAFSVWTWTASVAAVIWDRCDPFVIGPTVGSMQLGVYLLAAELATLPTTELVGPASDVLFASFSMAQREGRRPADLAMPTAAALVLMIMPLMVGISVTSGYLVAGILGPNWAQAQSVVAVSAWAGLFSPFGFVCQSALISSNHLRSNMVANGLTSLLKLGVLAAVVAVSTNLVAISAANIAIMFGEALIFIALLLRAERAEIWPSVPSLLRSLLAGTTTLALLYLAGLRWQSVAMASWEALLIGGGIGVASIATFVAVSFLLWLASGRPVGSETRVARMVAHVAGAILDKLRPRTAPTA